jgi:hypothetical protein
MRPERDAKMGRFLVGHSSVGHRFLPGNSGLPGRPKAARNKLAEAMIDDLIPALAQAWHSGYHKGFRRRRPATTFRSVIPTFSPAFGK